MRKTIEEIKKRIEKIKEFDRIFVIYHYDIDGCASASALWRILKTFHKNAKFIPSERGFETIVVSEIEKEDPEKIILLDYVPGKELLEVLKKYNSEIIDHHTHEKRLEVINYFTSSDYEIGASLSYLMAKVAEEFGIKNVEWLGYLGSFWDKCMEHTEFYKEGIYKEKLEELLPFNLVVSFTQTKGSKKMLEIMNESSTLEEAMEKTKNLEDYRLAKKIFEEELRNILFNKKTYPNIKLSIYRVKTKFKHIRIYVDYITYQNDGTFLFILDENTRFKFSFRTTIGINLLNIVEKLKEKFKEFTGGGHKYACGGLLLSQNVEELVDSFIKLYSKEYEKEKSE